MAKPMSVMRIAEATGATGFAASARWCGWSTPSSLREFAAMFSGLRLALSSCGHLRSRLWRLRGVRSGLVTAMNLSKVCASRTDLKVLQAIVAPVVVDVMHDVPRWDRAVGAFPYQAVLENE
jgi:hypothetical protein